MPNGTSQSRNDKWILLKGEIDKFINIEKLRIEECENIFIFHG